MTAKRCVLCGGSTVFHLRCGTYVLHRCTKCGVRFLDSIPPQTVLDRYYQDTFYSREGARFSTGVELFIRLFRHIRAREVMRTAQRGPVLDIGFSRGIMLSVLKRRGWQSYGITNSRNVFRHAKHMGLAVRYGELPNAKFPKAFFTAVTMWHVLEHLRQPARYIRECRRILRRGGRIIIEVPNAGSPLAAWFGCHWLGIDLPRHLSHFTPEALAQLLERNGFAVTAVRYFSLEHSVFSVLQSMGNTIGGKSNVLLESMKCDNRVSQTAKWLHYGIAAALFPLACILAVSFAVCRKGDIMRVYAVKR